MKKLFLIAAMTAYCVLFAKAEMQNTVYAHAAALDEEHPFYQTTWRKFADVCEDSLALIGEEDRQSRTFLEVITLRKPKYARLIKKAQNILGDSQSVRKFEEIGEIVDANRKCREEINDLRRKRISAPSSSMNPLTTTKKSIDRRLNEIPLEIAQNEERMGRLKMELQADLAKEGIFLEPDEISYFLVAAEGGELAQLMAIAENMKKIHQIMQSELEADPNNAEAARVYAGMYLLSLEAFMQSHATARINIEGYRAKLADLAAEARKNLLEGKRLLRGASAEEKDSLERNMRTSEKANEVAKMYDGLLKRRIGSLASSQKKLTRKIEIARNTYNTMANSASIIRLVSNGDEDYAMLLNFDMPELRTIYDSAMLNAFEELTNKIRHAQ